MISIKVSIIFQLFDGFTMKPLGRSAAVFADGVNAHAEYRSGGYYVLVNLEPGWHELSIQSPYFQTERLRIEVSELPVRRYLSLKKTKNYPFSKQVTRLSVTCDESIYIAKRCDSNEFKLAQDSVNVGKTEFRLYIRKPPLGFYAGKKLLFFDGVRTEVSELLNYDGQTAKITRPLSYIHKRGTTIYPCEIYYPENRICFAVLDEPSRVLIYCEASNMLKEIDLSNSENYTKI